MSAQAAPRSAGPAPLRPERPGWTEVGGVLLLLCLVALLVFGPSLSGGAFLLDDWVSAEGGTPSVGGVLGPLAHDVLGESAQTHLAVALALGVLMCASVYLVLRRLGLAPLHAVPIVLLLLLFPFSDATRFWAAAGLEQLGVVLFALGFLVSLAAFGQGRAWGRRALVGHVAACVLYVLGLAVTDVVGGAVLLAVLGYRLAGFGWRTVLVRWPADVLVLLLAALLLRSSGRGPEPAAWGDRLERAVGIAREAVGLLGAAAVPVVNVGGPLVLAVVAVVAVVAAVAWVRSRSARVDPSLRAALRRWLVAIAAGVGTVVAGYATVVRASEGGPLDPGTGNRVNLLAGVGFVITLYASAALAGVLLTSVTRRSALVASVLPLAFAALLVVGYAVRLDRTEGHYERARAEQRQVLGAIREAGPYPPGATLFAFGATALTAPGVPVFSDGSDFGPATRRALGLPRVQALGLAPAATMTCAAASVAAVGPHSPEPATTGRYGATYFVDVARRSASFVRSAGQCRTEAIALPPGRLLASDGDCRLDGVGPAVRLPWLCTEDQRDG